MNKEELKELAATLNGIADGKAWEITGNRLLEQWHSGTEKHSPLRLVADGWKIRLKPQPDPYEELKAAHAAGKKLQHRCPGESKWLDCSVTDTTQAPYCFVFEPECYRIKPEQQKVPLGPGDVPPGTVFRFHGHNDNHHYSPTLVAGPKDGVYFTDTTHFRRDWSYLMENATINRSIPITGKWNPEAWEPCCKLIDKP